MNRTSFIRTSVALAIAAGIPAFYKWHQLFRRNKMPLIHPDILSHFGDEETLQKIGNTYRSIVPAENSESQLHKLLLDSVQGKEMVLPDPAILSSLLDLEIQQDFYAEKIINVRGWIISVTEARQCALLTFA